MRKLLLSLFFVMLFICSYAQYYNEKYGNPLVVLIEADPWLMVIGSDAPGFALYENGQVIYKKMVDNKQKYFQLTGPKEGVAAMIRSFKITDSLQLLPFYMHASDWTDQPTNTLILNFDTLKRISVYGRLRDLKNEARNNTPECFLNAFDTIIHFESKDAVEWIPDSIEVMAVNYSYSSKKPAKWLENCGDLKTATTVKRNADLYSIYIDKKYFPDLVKLIKGLKRGQAVEINGEKFSLYYRFPFPNLR